MLAYFERTRTPLTSFIHSFRFSMMFFSSAMLKPVSFCSWSTYVNAGLPLFLAPCFGSQSSRSLITSSFFKRLKQQKLKKEFSKDTKKQKLIDVINKIEKVREKIKPNPKPNPLK